jgi:hypothetical protein
VNKSVNNKGLFAAALGMTKFMMVKAMLFNNAKIHQCDQIIYSK